MNYEVILAMWLLGAGILKYGERIYALKHASKKGPESSYCDGPPSWSSVSSTNTFRYMLNNGFGIDPPIGNNQFENYAFIVMRAHVLCHVFLRPLVIDRNKVFIL